MKKQFFLSLKPPKARQILLALLALSAVTITNAATATANMRPGLWEIKATSDIFKLARLSPESIQTLKTLAEQYGVDISQLQIGETSSQVCISPETANASIPPNFHDPDSGCKTKNPARNGNKYSYEFTCPGPQMKGTGTAQGAFTTPEHFSGETRFSGVAQGMPVDEQGDISGRWVSSNCGGVEPF
ncbi:MAG TPA: DUF3617 domain-containing protein [Methylophilaceae bacterium]|jgi:hypothetical protein